jgi:hypothetical protein
MHLGPLWGQQTTPTSATHLLYWCFIHAVHPSPFAFDFFLCMGHYDEPFDFFFRLWHCDDRRGGVGHLHQPIPQHLLACAFLTLVLQVQYLLHVDAAGMPSACRPL